MSDVLSTAIVSGAVAVIVGWPLTCLVMRMLVPSLEASGRTVRNYRGAEVVTGLGTVWLVWAVLVLVAVTIVAAGSSVLGWVDASPWTDWFVPALLVVVSFAFGLVDDAYGASDAKGFKGHISSMLRARLTTGGLKLLGIGVASLMAAFSIQASRLLVDDSGIRLAAGVVLGTLVIALSANLVNLTDLRPGRALKTYVFLVLLAIPGLVVWAFTSRAVENPYGGWSVIAVAVPLALGPVLAVWSYDLGERAMLGDAGANAMGALAGYLFAATLPLWGLVVTTVVLGALNLLSERVSFSKVIEANAPLRWIDGLGRLKGPARPGGTDREQADRGSAAPSGSDGEADTRKDGAE